MATKHVVFMFHGMGKHSPDWAQTGIDTLRNGWKKLGLSAGVIGVKFDFIPIAYDDVFEDYWDAADAHSKRFSELSIPASTPGTLKQLVSAIADLDSDSFWVSHLADVALYRFTRHGDMVVHDISKRILQTLRDMGDPPYSIIAHSLGTAVATDVIRHLLEDARKSIHDRKFRHSIRKPDTLMMMGNVSRLLERSSLFSANTGFFPSTTMLKGACRNYIDVNHPLDPFSRLRPFKPPVDWGGSRPNLKQFHQPEILRNDIVPPVNPHSFSHYLSHPNVQSAFFQRTLQLEGDTNKLERTLSVYRTTTLKGQSSIFADELLAMPVKTPRDIDEKVNIISDFLDTLDAFKPVWIKQV